MSRAKCLLIFLFIILRHLAKKKMKTKFSVKVSMQALNNKWNNFFYISGHRSVIILLIGLIKLRYCCSEEHNYDTITTLLDSAISGYNFETHCKFSIIQQRRQILCRHCHMCRPTNIYTADNHHRNPPTMHNMHIDAHWCQV